MTDGQIAFEAYCESVENTAHTGRPIPPWDELPEHIRKGWDAGVDAVLRDRAYINGRQLNDLHLRVLRAALHAYVQVHLGQPQKVMEHCRMLWSGDAAECEPGVGSAVMKILDVVATITTGVRNGGPGIFNTERVRNDARIAYRILAILEKDTGMVLDDGSPAQR